MSFFEKIGKVNANQVGKYDPGRLLCTGCAIEPTQFGVRVVLNCKDVQEEATRKGCPTWNHIFREASQKFELVEDSSGQKVYPAVEF